MKLAMSLIVLACVSPVLAQDDPHAHHMDAVGYIPRDVDEPLATIRINAYRYRHAAEPDRRH